MLSRLQNKVLYAIDRTLGALSRGRVRVRKYYLVAQPVARRRWLPPSRGKTIEVRRVSEGDPLLGQAPRPEGVFRYRFEQAAVCITALKADELIGFLWLTLGPYQEDEVRCRYVPEGTAAWDFDVYVKPSHRDGIAFLKLWDEANGFLAAHGVQSSLSRISAFNEGSLRSHSRMGARRIAALLFVCVGSWQLTLASVAPYFHVSTRPDRFPVFGLNGVRRQAEAARHA